MLKRQDGALNYNERSKWVILRTSNLEILIGKFGIPRTILESLNAYRMGLWTIISIP